MTYNNSTDQYAAAIDLDMEDTAAEQVTAGTSSSAFSTSIQKNRLHIIQNASTDTSVYCSLDGTDVVISDGAGTAGLGFVVGPGGQFPICPQDEDKTLKVRTNTGTAIVCLHRAKNKLNS